MSSVWHAPVGSFQAERPHTLAIYCSDGRYAEACDWFIEHVLGESRFDQFAVPAARHGCDWTTTACGNTNSPDATCGS